MKKIGEVCRSYAPWKQGYKYVSDGIVFDLVGNLVAETVNDLDARLIAAAPELYEACSKLVEWSSMRDASIEDIIADARTACVKAGGAE